MGLFSDLFGTDKNFVPDYRDIILYNGLVPYRASGKFSGNLIEFEKSNNPSTKIYLNTNLTADQYILNHKNFDLVRNNDGTNFSEHGMHMAEGHYIPTGRFFISNGLKKWEMMKENDPSDVYYIKVPFTDDQFIFGKQCLEISLK